MTVIKTPLTIQFNYMMLFLRTKDGMDVLLPKKGHRATVRQAGGRQVDAPPGTRVFLEVNSVAATGEVTVQRHDRASGSRTPYDERIVNVRQLLGEYKLPPKSAFVNPRLKRGNAVDGAWLNARVELGGGSLQAASCLCAKEPRLTTHPWRFVLPDGSTYWNRPLTDRALYSLERDELSTYKLHVERPDGSKDVLNASDGSHFEIENGDEVGGSANTIVLSEMLALYDLYVPSLIGLIKRFPECDPLPASAPLAAAKASPIGASAMRSPEIPMCPPLDDCEDPSNPDPSECEKP